jgi:FkbM family methyltransferase
MRFLPRRIRHRVQLVKKTFRRFTLKTQCNVFPFELGEFDGFLFGYRKNSVDEKVLADSFTHDKIFVDVPEFVPDLSHVILDVGAHIGTFAAFAATKVQTVYAVEACRETFNLLRANAELNHLSNIRSFHLALSDRDGPVELVHSIYGNWGNSIMYEKKSASEPVEGMTLDRFVLENEIEKIHFVKFNCEGAEFPILLAASLEVLQRFEVMYIHYHEDLSNGLSHQLIIEHLEAAGFAIRRSGPQRSKRGTLIATHETRQSPQASAEQSVRQDMG